MNLLGAGVTYSWYRNREREYVSFFSTEETILYCNDVHELMKQLGIHYDTHQWRLFIDSNKSSLKAVLLHNWNQYASLPMAHSVKKIKCEDHGWMICGPAARLHKIPLLLMHVR